MRSFGRPLVSVFLFTLVPALGFAVQFDKLPGCCDPAGNTSSFHPAVAPDGGTVMYVYEYFQYPDAVFDQLKLAGQASSAYQWAEGIPSLYPSWSPDGTRIAAIYREGFYQSPDNGLWIYSDDPQVAPIQLVAGEGFGRTSWTSDGTVVVFAGPNDTIMMALASSAVGAFTLPFTGRNPSWGEQEVAVMQDGDIWVKSSEGERALTSGPAQDDWPSWSPDGRWVAFETDRAGNSDIWIVSRTGGTPLPLTTAVGYDGQPSWSPDGTSIVFLSDRDGAMGLWRASDLPDFTVAVEEVPWTTVKEKYREE